MNDPTTSTLGRIEPALLLRTLQQLKALEDDGAEELLKACDGINAQHLSLQPAEWLRLVFARAGIKGITVMQLNWRRFDLRRLPALVWHRTRWHFAERDASGDTRLRDAGGEMTSCTYTELQDAVVVWLRIANSTATSSNSQGPLAGNLAAQMVWRELWRDSSWVAKVVTATVLINLLAIATSIFAMQVYDRVVPTMAYATLTTLVSGMALIVIFDWVLKVVRARILDSLSCAVDKRVSQQVFEHLLRLQLDAQPRSLGTLAAQVSSLDTVRQFFSASIVFTLVDLPFAFFFLAFIAIIGGAVGWVYALLLPLALLLGVVTQWRLRALSLQQMMRSNERQGLLVDTIRGAESIRASHSGWRFAQEWQAITAAIDGYNIRQKAISTVSSTSTASLSTVAYVAAVVVGVWQIEAGLLTTGGLIACSILGGRIIAPVAQSVQYLTQWQQVSQALQMVHKVLALPLERRPGQHLLLPDEAPSAVSLSQLRFAYPESPVQQVDVSQLEVKAGERVLLLGPIGCGKSTLLKLMAGLYRPSQGRVRLGDADLWEIDPQAVANHVAYLPQAVHLFKGTLRSNLMLSGTASDSQMLKTVKALGIDAIAAGSPLGMELPISEGGEGLSGGQRQLLALARLMLSAPRIWLLDEPTASLDSESEARVWKSLEESLAPEDILVVATHRPMPAMKLATRVIVMQQGTVHDDGPPSRVLSQNLARRTMPPSPQLAMRSPKLGGDFDVI